MILGAPEALHSGVLHAVLRVTGVQPPLDVPAWGMATNLTPQAVWAVDALAIHVDPAHRVVPWVVRLNNTGIHTIQHPDQHLQVTGDAAFTSESGSCAQPLLPGKGCTVHGLLNAGKGRAWTATLQSDAAPPLTLVAQLWTPDVQFMTPQVSVKTALDHPVTVSAEVQNLGPVEGPVEIHAPIGMTPVPESCPSPLGPHEHCTLTLSVDPGTSSGSVQIGNATLAVDVVPPTP